MTVPLHALSWAAARVDLVFELPRRLQVGGSERASFGTAGPLPVLASHFTVSTTTRGSV
ncbi:hypothetical protein [Dactylosporangium sp. NPDC005555]|uniref:hypothetical protein n=1 Tax=Dactylosporangium sp. NPDC005555 TaxID=3154889 RepID=UPI0033A18CC8